MYLRLQDHDFEPERDLYAYVKNGILIDTSVLKIIIDGIITIRLSKKESSELKKIEDFLEYIKIRNNWKKFFITPHVLTEVCNHVRNEHSKDSRFKTIIEEIMPILRETEEKNADKKTLISLIDINNPVLEIGDMSIYVVADDYISRNDKIALLADDHNLNSRYVYDRHVLVLDYRTNIINLP
ncbi:MAG: hypothetical protein MUO21_03455 [Nitrososphaeraceae archaeon]|nr:hypothetical protein [Nitrososphaeraceae archaeon]